MQDAPDNCDAKTEWAEQRTDWAEDRTIMANERTFAGWMRTGLASVGVALGLKAVFGDFDPTWAPKAAATIFVLAAIFIIWSARQAAIKTGRRIDEHAIKHQTGRRMTILAVMLSLGAAATGWILWML